MTDTPLKLFASFAVVTLLSLQAMAVDFSRSPYLQQPTSDSALVAFTFDSACPAVVHYGPGTDRSLTATSEAATRHHVLALTGLPAETQVGYEIDGCGEPTGRGGQFVTAPVKGTRRVHFSAVGDFGTGGDLQQDLVRSLMEDDPELLLALGDVAYDSGTQAEVENKFFAPMAELMAKVPFYVVLGNHEYVTDAGMPLLDAVYMPSNNAKGTERYYSFDRGHVHFVALDSMCAGAADSSGDCTSEAQMKWLEADLAATDQPWKIVFFHHPPYTSSPKDSKSIREKYVPIMQAGGVDLALTAHAHNYERSFPLVDGVPAEGGITYIVAGAGGARLKEFVSSSPPDWSAVRNNSDFGYLDVNVEEGLLSAEARTMDGRVIDAFELTKELPPVSSLPPPQEETPPPVVDGNPPVDDGNPPVEPGSNPQAPGQATFEKPKSLSCATGGTGAWASLLLVVAGLGLGRGRLTRVRDTKR